MKPIQPDTATLPRLPLGWTWACAEQVCDFITKGTTPPKGFDDAEPKTVPFIRVTNLTTMGALDFTDKVFVSEQTHKGFLSRSIVYQRDVLMNIVGPPLGQVSIVPSTYPEWNINQAIAIFRPLDGVSAAYLTLVLFSPYAQQWLASRAKTTAGQTNLTLEVCRALPIPLPPANEQAALQEIVDADLGVANGLAEALMLGVKQSAAQRQNILKAAFSGQLVPQDPNDEPASVLLERIRTERAAAGSGVRRGRKARGLS